MMYLSLLLVLFWIVFSLAVATIARAKNRSGFIWFFISFLCSPLIAIICVNCLPTIIKEGATQTSHSSIPQVMTALLRDCPECAEVIKSAAKKCKHCGSKVTALEAVS